MKAGRELDVLIARHVVGLHLAEWADEGDWWVTTDPKNPADGLEAQASWWWPLPGYSISMGAAWEVVEHCCKGGVFINFEIAYDMKGWHVDALGNDGGCCLVAATAPLVICLAALKCVGVEVSA